MRKTIVLSRRIWHHSPYVLPADVLSAEPTHVDDPSSLREEASCDGHCYLKLTRSFGNGTYLVRVAASPEHLRHQGYTVVLDQAQIAKTLPWHDFLYERCIA
jgi:hypothetical protein